MFAVPAGVPADHFDDHAADERQPTEAALAGAELPARIAAEMRDAIGQLRSTVCMFRAILKAQLEKPPRDPKTGVRPHFDPARPHSWPGLVDFFAEEWSRVADCTRVFGEEAELPARQITSLADYLIELDRLVKFCGTTADRWEARLGTNGSAPVDSPSSGAEQQLPTAVPVSPAVPGREQSILPPDPPLLSWSAIIAAINELQGETVLKDSAEGQQTVRKTHSHLAGPIKFGRKGSQPRVGKRALIQWWTEAVESVTSATEDNEQRRESRAAVSESIHDHGRGEVAADVSGSVKKRRK